MKTTASKSTLLRAFVADDRAATAPEYAILACMIALVLVGALTAFGISLRSPFQVLGGTVTPKR